MLEKLPHAVGRALSGIRAGLDKAAYHAEFADAPATIAVTSAAFADGAAIPARYTQDGPKLSPPLAWTGVPGDAGSVALLVEDVDSPTPSPFVHLIAWNLAPGEGYLPEADIASPGAPGTRHDLGKNTFLKTAYLPPDPPTGHGAHRYLFQVYALDRTLDLPPAPGRSALVAAMRGHVLAKGSLTGTYERA